jgi:gliding motility-associated-like protein
MLSHIFMQLSPFHPVRFKPQRGLTIFGAALFFFFFLGRPNAQTCVFDSFVLASNNPFGSCPAGTDTIIIRDSFVVDVNYEPIIGGVPFEGLLIIDGGVINWSSNVYLKLGYAARVVLINGGLFRPVSSGASDCNGLRALFFDTKKTVNCNGVGAPHAFSDVNMSGCVTELGICCNAFIAETDSSGNYNDLTLCQPGDTARLSVVSSGQLGFSYFWTPNIGPGAGPYPITPVASNTPYYVSLTAIFDPYGAEPPYLLTCSGAVNIKVNDPLNLTATSTSVPCAGVATGNINLTVSGGTAPYQYRWSDNSATQDLNNVPAGAYTVTVTDSKGCTNTLSVSVLVDDNVPPVVSCPPNAAGIATPGSCTTLIPNINAVFSDNCPTVGVTYTLSGATSGSGAGQLTNTVPFSSGITTVTYTVDDGSNAVSCNFTVTVQDNQLPTASNPAPLTGIQCLAAIPAPNTAEVTTEADNCGAPAVTFLSDNIAGGGGCPGDTLIVLRKYRVSDAAGNSITVTQTIRVVDNQSPVFITVPGDVAVNCQSIPPVGSPAASDNCSASVTITYNGETRTNGACTDSYTLRRRWTASDNCGNTKTAEQVITVQDVAAPAFTFVPTNTTVSCDALPAPGAPAATDNCDATVAITYDGQTRTDGACPDTYILKRRWIATDNCGNTKSAEQQITVQDVTQPVFTFVPGNTTVNCDAVPAPGTPTASDNCDASVNIVYNGQTKTNGACPDTYTLKRLWTATDNCGNTKTAEQTIAVQDVTKPVFTFVPANTIVNCDAVPAVGTPTASDNCAANVSINFVNELRTNGACPDKYTLTRQWMATDACGNTQMATQTLTVQDVTNPVFTFVPANVTLTCESIPPAGAPTATDNCDASASITYNGEVRTNGACPDTYTLTRRWTATDNCGNTTTTTQLLTIQDVTAPVFTSVPANVTVSCDAIPPAGAPAATDNCDAAVAITYNGETRTDGACADNYTLTRRWTATDNCGNTKTTEQTLTIRDQTLPVFTFVPANAVVNCEAIPNIASPEATDNCDANVLITFAGVTQSSGNCASGGTVSRRWIATDNCGNTATAEQLLTVQDTTKPAFIYVPANLTVSCENIPAPDQPSASDNCSPNVDMVYDGELRANGACPDTYTLTRRWTAVDICGNTVSTTQVITVRDLAPPAFTLVPANITVNCDAVPPAGAPEASDNCDSEVSIAYNGETRTNGACPDTYSLVRRWTATDNCGNSVSTQQVITVQDITKPAFTFVPADATVNCENVPAVGTPLASDNCTAAVSIVYTGETRTNGACPDTYVLVRRWTATDNCGNNVSAEQVLTVQDIVPPVFTFVPANSTVTCESIPAAGSPTATDLCTANVSITYTGETRADGACPDTYTLTRMWTATDNCGNSSTTAQVLTVQDITPPVFTSVPVNITVNCESVPAVGAPNATDNCTANVTITYDGATRTDGACPDRYTLTRKWTATDNCGNKTTTQQTLTVQDNTPPVFALVPTNVTVSCEAIPSVGAPIASDNCTLLVGVTYDGETRTDGACSDTYILKRQWTATDNCGNSKTATQILTVQDITPPVFTAVPANTTVNCQSVPAPGSPAATDNCDAAVTITYEGQTRTDGNCPNNFVLQRRWTAMDNCGNTVSTLQILTVQDTTRPVLALVPANVTVSCEAIPAVGSPIASDNCTTVVGLNYDGAIREDGPCPDTYNLFRRWTATDDCGNVTTAEQKLTIQDIEKPVFTFVPADMTVNCEAVPVADSPAATDNCDAAVDISYEGETRIDGACPDSYSLRRRWTATDNCGNNVSTEQLITVEDTARPEFTFVPADATVSCEAIPGLGAPTATDNCASDVKIIFEGETFTGGDCASGGTMVRRWTAVDNCGNSAIAEQMLTVQDTTRPAFTYAPANLTVSCEAVPAVDAPTATDNCTTNVLIAYDGESRADGACPDTYILTRRWTASDLCGNKQATEQIIVVQDITSPVFTTVPGPVTVICEAVPAVGLPVASDNCDASVFISFDGEVRVDGACTDSYTLTRRWTATDNCGNKSTTEQIITVQDVAAPVFTFVPASLTASCAGVPPVGNPTATDNCAAAVSIMFNGESRTDGACPDNYTLRRYWTAADNCGNTATAEQIITVQDITPPVFTASPDNVTVDCDDVPGFGFAVASDNCTAVVAITYDGETRTDGTCPDTYLLRRRWTATDNCGNKATRDQIITVRDIAAPVFVSQPADVVVSCDAVPLPANPVATDNCDAAVAIDYQGETIISSNSPSTYLMRRRWIASDNCGNTAVADQLLSVRDTTPPVLNCPPSVSVNADAVNCDAMATFEAPFAADNCTNPIGVSSTAVSGDIFPIGTTTVLLTAKDDSGNTTTCTFTILVADTTAPVLVNCPVDMTLTTPDDACERAVSWTPPTVTDGCDAYAIVPQPSTAPGELFPTGVTLVTYTAKDTTGNTMTCSFTVTVNETVPPILANCPANMTLTTDTCNAKANWMAPLATDNCELDTLMSNFIPGTIFPEGETLVKYTALDVWGNTAECSFTITVKDLVGPVFSGCPSDIVVNSNGACSTEVDWTLPTATDNCDPDPTVFANPKPGDSYPVGYTNVFVFVEDPSGNTDTCIFKVTVIGPPLGFANTPTDQSFIGCAAAASWTPPTPTGVCGPVTVTSNYDPGSTFQVGTTTVVYTVSDTLGYTASASFNISVTESVPPQFNCPASPVQVNIAGAILSDPGKFLLSATAVSSCDGLELTFDYPEATDNCGAPLVEQLAGPATGTFFPIGAHLLEFRTTDAAGNSALCSLQIEVQPLLPLGPVISDKIGCAGDDITLSTPVIPGAAYIWTGPKPPYPNTNTLLIENLAPALTGIYTVQALWNGCLTPLDSALVRQGKQPDAVDDLDFEVETGALLENIDVVLNDQLELDDYIVTLKSQLPGLTETGNGVFSFQAGSANGRVSFVYQLCSAACPDLCDEAVVTITVRETFCSYIPNVITPNDDGINDYLEIPCLETELYPNNSLVIYNQWGDKVFQASPYYNDPANAWRGTLDGKDGKPLPDGTYFYYFQPTPDKKPLSGFIEVFR